jgi:hypothetical protein
LVVCEQLAAGAADEGKMRSTTGLVVGMFGVFAVVACNGFGSSSDADPAPAAPTPPGTTPVTDLPPGAAPPLVGSPSVDELTEKYGVFVATSGSADGDGTRAKPFSTITAGIERVKDLKLRVYVCSGVYKEAITLVSGVSVVGGLGCAGGTWTTGAARTRLESPTSPAVRARDIAFTTRFESFDVVVPAGTAAAPSSIAFIAERSPKLAVVSTKLAAGKGFDGADGADVAPLTLGAAAKGTDGLPYVGVHFDFKGDHRLGQAGGVGSCVGAAGHDDGGQGSAGGNGVTQFCDKAFFIAPTQYYKWAVYVDAGGVSYSRSNAAVLSSSAGTAGQDGDSARSLGALSADGYTPAAGTAGADGAAGKGGSGGDGGAEITGTDCTAAQYGYLIYGPSGPGGGAGGCPGLAGTAGGGGGASIAALVFASARLTFTTSELVAADGGKGGIGAFGTAPTAGGQPGVAKNGAPPGTAGGAGGRAGFSGNGSGGPSMALAYTGGDPVVASDTQTTAGLGGKGVIERTGTGVVIPASSDGPSKALFSF